MASKSPIPGVVPLPNGLNGLEMGVTKCLLSGMILQARGLSNPRFLRQETAVQKYWVYCKICLKAPLHGISHLRSKENATFVGISGNLRQMLLQMVVWKR